MIVWLVVWLAVFWLCDSVLVYSTAVVRLLSVLGCDFVALSVVCWLSVWFVGWLVELLLVWLLVWVCGCVFA